MKISGAFSSDWLKAQDIGMNRKVRCRIDRVEMEKIKDDEHKPVLYFDGKTKGLVLNKTNAQRLVAAYGDETGDWSGKEVILYVELVQYNGQAVQGIRVELPRQEVSGFAGEPEAQVVTREPASQHMLDDDPAPF